MTIALLFLGLLGTSTVLRADLPPIARKYAKRIGAPANLPANRPVRLRWRVRHYELDGTLVEELAQGQARRQLTAGPIEEAVAIKDAHVLRRDTNGQITEAGGLDRADLLSALAIDTGSWLHDGTKLTTLSADAKGRPRLRVDLPAPVELTFSTDGDLIERRILRGKVGELTTYDGWAKVGGRWIARHQTIHERNIAEVAERNLESAESLEQRELSPLPAARNDVHLPAGQSRIDLPLSLIHDRWLLASVDVAGRPALFLVDTGASSTVIDDGFASQAGIPLVGRITQQGGLFKSFRFGRTPSVTVGGAKVDPQLVIATDLAHSPLGGAFPGVVGILGFDFLSRLS